MKMRKMSFGNIKDVLSRDEMKEIMAGSGSLCGFCEVNSVFYACEFGGGNCRCTRNGAGC